MRTIRMGAVAATIGLTLLAAAGCKSSMHDQNLGLHTQNRELQERNRQLEAERDARLDPSAMAAKDAELAKKQQEIADLQNQLRQPAPAQGGTAATDPGIAGIETSFNKNTGEMTVNLPGDVLFDAGRASLKDSAKGTLNKIVSAIKKEYAGKHVFVDGHTDPDPIARTKGMWQDNLDLSAERARAVAKYLTTQGLEQKNVDTRAFGSTQPKKSKEASRRVEIVVATR